MNDFELTVPDLYVFADQKGVDSYPIPAWQSKKSDFDIKFRTNMLIAEDFEKCA